MLPDPYSPLAWNWPPRVLLLRAALGALVLSSFASAGLGQVPSVSIDGIEVTQGIQNSQNGVALVERRDTWVRVLLASESKPFLASGKLRLHHQTTGDTAVVESFSPGLVRQQSVSNARDARLRAGLLFRVPERFATLGEMEISLVLLRDSDTGDVLTCPDCVAARKTVRFQQGAPLRVHVIGLRYPLVVDGEEFEPRKDDFAATESLLRRMYPAAELQFSHRTADLTEDFINRRDPAYLIPCHYANGRVHVLRSLDIEQSLVDPRTHYYGMVSAGGYFMRGCGPGSNTSGPTSVAAGPTGPHRLGTLRPKASGWDLDASWGDSYAAHELGHTFGRDHVQYGPDSSGADPSYPYENAALGRLNYPGHDYVGFDAGDDSLDIPLSVLPGDSWHDVMSYAPWTWISAYTYDAIRVRLLAEDVAPAGPPPPPFGPEATTEKAREEQRSSASTWLQEQAVTYLIAVVDLTARTGSIRSLMLLDRAVLRPAPPDSSVVARVLDEGRNELGVYPLTVETNADAAADEPMTGVIAQAIPHHPNAARLELRLFGQVVDSVLFSPTPLALSEFGAGEQFTPPGRSPSIAFNWTLAQPIAAPVHYLVQVTVDGDRWQTVATTRDTTTVIVRLSDLPATPGTRVRLVATDGIHRAVRELSGSLR